MPEKRKVLILYTSVGLGHKTIAENLAFHLEQAGYVVQCRDALQLQQGRLVNVSKAVHRFINSRLPAVWRWLYFSRLFAALTLPLRTRVASRNYRNILRVIDGFAPFLVITTETAASAAMAYLKRKGRYHGLFAIAFSDFHLHRYWLYAEADFYLANIEMQKRQMAELGVAAERIAVCGITLKPKRPVSRAAARAARGFEPADKFVLFGSGSQGIGPSAATLLKAAVGIWRGVRARGQRVKIAIVCGNNVGLQKQLLQAGENPDIVIYGYYSAMHELYAAADVFVTKPGGLSVAEALLWKLPIIVSHVLPGQEDANLRYLIATRLVLNALDNAEQTVRLALAELSSGKFRRELDANPFLRQIADENNPGGRAVQAVARFIDKC